MRTVPRADRVATHSRTIRRRVETMLNEKEADDARAAKEKARIANKAGFRP
jgi:hypothetical protein